MDLSPYFAKFVCFVVKKSGNRMSRKPTLAALPPSFTARIAARDEDVKGRLSDE